jgi:hypothetical protein
MRHKHTARSEAIAGMGRAAEATSRRIVAEVPPPEPTRSPPQVWQGGLGLRPRSGWAVLIEGARPGRRGGIQSGIHREKHWSACPIFGQELIRNSIQPVPLDATRCYLLETLYSGLTCTNGCSCWSPPEGRMAPVCRCKRHALPLRHTPINYCLRRSTLVGVSRRPV